jgi:predicted RNA-binding protein with PUA-like domain
MASRKKKRPKADDRGPKKKAAGSRKPASTKPSLRKNNPSASGLGPAATGSGPRSPVPTSASYADGKWAEWFTRAPGERRYWLVKSEPQVFSFDDLLRAPGKSTYWDGVRNFAARNFLRDGMKLGDRVFFYHSMADPQVIAGICEVARESYPDFTALDPKHEHFDPDSNPDAPTWFMVDLRAVAQFTRPVPLSEIKARKELADMALLRIGRLSVTPVRPKEWETIVGMAR